MVEGVWVLGQTNQALTSLTDVDHACTALTAMKVPLHPDRNKNWDNYLALWHTLHSTDFDMPILDAGAGDESAYLPGLREYGYTNLIGCNLDRKDDYTAGAKNGILKVYADITASPFPNSVFGFVSCLSVIEHGVNWRAFLVEMHRILRPGAGLFISFDYWKDKVDTDGLVTHGSSVNIFSEQEVKQLLDFANTVGLELIGHPWDGECADSIIHWAGRSYTFGNILLRKFI